MGNASAQAMLKRDTTRGEPGARINWGVWESPASFDGAIAHGHDDLLISTALCSILDQQDWPGTGSAVIVSRGDPLEGIDLISW